MSLNNQKCGRSRTREKHPVGLHFRCHRQKEKEPRQTYRAKPMLLDKSRGQSEEILRILPEVFVRAHARAASAICLEETQQIPLAVGVAPSSVGSPQQRLAVPDCPALTACAERFWKNAIRSLCLLILSRQRMIASFMESSSL